MAMGSKTSAGNTYEEARKQRIEENKRRFKDLGISDLSNSLSKTSNFPNSKRRPKPRSKADTVSEWFEPRRSSRSRTPVASYFADVCEGLEPRRSSRFRAPVASYADDFLAEPRRSSPSRTLVASYDDDVDIFRTSSGEKPNADTENSSTTETEAVLPSQRRQKVKDDEKHEENDDLADGEESQPKARRGSGRRTAVKNETKENGLAVKSHKDQLDPVPQEHGKKNDEKDNGADGEKHHTEARGRKSGRRRSKVANKSREVVLAIQAPIKILGLAGEDEKKTVEAAIGEKPGRKVIKPRKKPAHRLFRRKVFRD